MHLSLTSKPRISLNEWIVFTVVFFCVFASSISAQEEPADPTLHLWRQSVEQVVILNADYQPFQDFVGNDFDVFSNEGQALLLIVLQDTKTNFLNGKEAGPSQDVHIWVSINGPRSGTEISVIGAQSTLKTMSWFKLFGGSSQPQVRSAFADSGLLYEPIEDFSLVHSGSEIQGKVVIGPERSFSWKAIAKAPWAELIGVNHDFYSRDQDDRLVSTHVQALVKALAWESEGILEVQGDVIPSGLLSTSTRPVKVHSFNPIWIRASVSDFAKE
jgi:hypothetical protein